MRVADGSVIVLGVGDGQSNSAQPNQPVGHLYDVTLVQWGVDSASQLLDGKGWPKSVASDALARHTVTLWLRLRDASGQITEFDQRHVLRTWCSAPIRSLVASSNVGVVLYSDVPAATLSACAAANCTNAPVRTGVALSSMTSPPPLDQVVRFTTRTDVSATLGRYVFICAQRERKS